MEHKKCPKVFQEKVFCSLLDDINIRRNASIVLTSDQIDALGIYPFTAVIHA